MKRKGYPEGLEQLENNPELAGIEVNSSDPDIMLLVLSVLKLKIFSIYSIYTCNFVLCHP